MEYWFSYTLKMGNSILRIGKSHCFEKTGAGILRTLRKRYNSFDWDRAEYSWHSSEPAALKKENVRINAYVEHFGVLPPYNVRAGGGGRQRYDKCKAIKADNTYCLNDALEGNYRFCGKHRQLY